MINIGFIIEQGLGHVTHSQNLRRDVAHDPGVQAYWGLPSWTTNKLARKIPVYKSNWTLQAGLQTRRLLKHLHRQANLDVLFFHTQITAVLAQDWMRSIPSVVSLDATPEQYDRLGETYAHHRGPEWLERRKWRLNRDCYRTAKSLVTWSDWAKNGLVDDYQVPAEKITVIPPGVNIAEWASPVQPVRQLSPAEDVVRILFVGGDLQRKGGLVLLEAFRALRQEVENWDHGSSHAVELHLVTRRLMPAETGVFIHNNLEPNSPELKELFSRCDIFCLPTLGDCLPMVLSEAGAAGLPLVSTRVGGIPEIVREGETGFLVPAGDPAALAFALRQLVGDPMLRRRMGDCAAELVRRHYDAELNTARLLDLLKLAAKDSIRNE